MLVSPPSAPPTTKGRGPPGRLRDIAQLCELCATRRWHHARPRPHRSRAFLMLARLSYAVARRFTSRHAAWPVSHVARTASARCLTPSATGRASLLSDDAPAAAPAQSGDPVSLAESGQREALSYPACLPKPCLPRCSSLALRDLRSARMSTVPQRQRRERSAPVVSGRSWLPR